MKVRLQVLAFCIAQTAGLIGTQAWASAVHNPADAVPRAVCGADSLPETGVQGQVPLADRRSKRSAQGYRCNLELRSQYQGTGNATIGQSYQHCMYYGSTNRVLTRNRKAGVQVVDFSDKDNPKLSTVLRSIGMQGGSWETLKVHEGRGLLAAASVPLVWGGVFLSIYDVGKDCAQPRLLNGVFGSQKYTRAMPFMAHEGAWSPDGNTYWVTGNTPGSISAIDVRNPKRPRVIYKGFSSISNHGMAFSPDGNLMYVANQFPAGFSIFDVSEVQHRKWGLKRIHFVSQIKWKDGMVTQQPLPFTHQGKNYVFVTDELAGGGVRLVDVSDPHNPTEIRKYELEIHRPENKKKVQEDVRGNGIFGYEAHYCAIDKSNNPTALACGYTQSGVRVFDVRDIFNPKEIAYFNPPAQFGKRKMLKNSMHAQSRISSSYTNDPGRLIGGTFTGKNKLKLNGPDLSADWCMSAPQFRGNELWTQCDDNGGMVLRFTNGVYPFNGTP